MVYEYITENYKPGEPIFLSDIKIDGITNENLRYHLKKLTDDGVLNRFEQGVYYIPKKGVVGEIPLSPDKYMYYKFINKKNNNFGFYSGNTLANKMHLSNQVPNKIEITSNNAPTKMKEFIVDGRKYIVRKAIVEITNDNCKVLQLLECLKDVDKYADDDENIKQILTDYIMENDISKEMIDEYINKYPLKVYKAIYETGVNDVLTQREK